MESRQESHDRYIEKLEKHIESTKENLRYSSDRFDILVISLSTTALILSIGFVKNIVSDITKIDTSLLKTSWLFFVLAITSNLISQVTGYYASKSDITVTRSLIDEEKGKGLIERHSQLDEDCKMLNNWTLILNGLSLLLLIFGVVILLIFLSNNF